MNHPTEKPVLLILFLLISITSLAGGDSKDTTYWASGGYGAVSFSQVMLKNWAGGGQPSVSVNGRSGFLRDYKRNRITWENSLDLGYGLVKEGNSGSLIKSDDQANLVSKLGYRIQNENEKWYYSLLTDFRTQFDKSYVDNPNTSDIRRDSVISKFMTPAYVTIGLGLDYKPSDKLSFNYIPLTGKFTIVNSQPLADLGAYGVPDGNKGRGEFGSYLRIKFKGDIMDNINLDSRVELFSNYTDKEATTVDVNIQNNFILKVNRFVTANFFVQMLYDKDIRKETVEGVMQKSKPQYKSVIGLGLGHKIGKQRKR